MANTPLYILPGESRSKDRILPAEMLEIEFYIPSSDMNLSEENRKYRSNSLKVTVRGEETKVYPFVLPCSFRPEWNNLQAAAQDMGMDIAVGEPVKDEDSIGRSIVRNWFATADGCVYTGRKIGGANMLITEQWPIHLDATWIQKQIASTKATPPLINEQSYGEAEEIAVSKLSWSLVDGNESKTFDGKIMGVTDNHVVQSLGKTAVIHHKHNLDRVPAKDDVLTIAYDGLGKAQVSEMSPDKGVSR